MAKIRINPEELEQATDVEETSALTEFAQWIQRNASVLLLGIAVVVGGFTAFSYMDSIKQGNLAKASMVYDEISIELLRSRGETTWASPERKTKMEEVIKKADELIEANAGTPLAREALFLKGTAYFQMGDEVSQALQAGAPNNQRAIEVFNEYYAQVEPNTFERAKAALALAYALENSFFFQGERQAATDALQYYTEAGEADPYGFLKADATMGRARILTATGKDQEAIALYREILEKRFEPVVLMDSEVVEGRFDEGINLVNAMRARFLAQISIAGQARLELARFGIDVEKEYPITKEAEEETEATTNT
ncbi:MAG: tetratricopeptide repeat protein [Candidatus Sumerlaeia bacterium]|nr:tetratricopeptide repeat protein [Candidatus Sumerlaeia bacterium]